MTATLKIIDSWRSLKTWIKLWLVWLNVVLLAAVFFLDDPVARWTLASLPVSLVILVWIAVRQGGLVRILGVGHLVPWLPLITYLELRLLGEWAGPRITYDGDPWLFIWAIALWASLGVCLAFDGWDVVRWYQGERFVLGTPEAAEAGASKLSPRHS